MKIGIASRNGSRNGSTSGLLNSVVAICDLKIKNGAVNVIVIMSPTPIAADRMFHSFSESSIPEI
jgi:hypothetical protein